MPDKVLSLGDGLKSTQIENATEAKECDNSIYCNPTDEYSDDFESSGDDSVPEEIDIPVVISLSLWCDAFLVEIDKSLTASIYWISNTWATPG